ncbi:MAG TPA: hypothetical protein VF070_23295 [Streptosporangiaceae bacterium]
MSSETSKNSPHGQAVSGEDTLGDILGGPDPGGREDILPAPGREPHPGTDTLGGPDAAGPEDEFAIPGRPADPAPHDILGGPDSAGTEDIMNPADRR